MNPILVTGGTGFIGQYVVRELASAGHEVHVLSRRPGQPLESVTWHAVDLHEGEQVKSVLERIRPAAVAHLAWITTPGMFWRSTENLLWVETSLRLLRGLAEVGCRRVLLAGTCAEYALRAGRCDERRTPLQPTTVYGTAKLATTSTALSAAEILGLEVAVGRIFFPYGPGEPAEKLVTSTVRSILAGTRAPCTAGTQRRDFLEVSDVAAALVALLCSEVVGAVNIGSGHATRVADLVLMLGEMLGRPDLVGLGDLPSSSSDPPLIEAVIDRLRFEVGWQPTVTLAEGLTRTIAWCRAQPVI